jgi:hypothetical protein
MGFKTDKQRKAVMRILRIKIKVFPAMKAHLRNPVSVPYVESKRTKRARQRLLRRKPKK